MIDLTKQNELFISIGRKLKRKIECYVIGGSALMYYGVKETTKDVDLVVLNKKDRDDILDILFDLGFSKRSTKFLYTKKENVPILLELGESRVDLFMKDIICFKFSESMINRVEKVYDYGNLIMKVISLEDVILLKCATERAGDRSDVKTILEKVDINWDYIIDESVRQTKTGKHIFPVFLYDFLMELKEDLKVDIPNKVINEIRKIGEKEMIKSLRKDGVKFK